MDLVFGTIALTGMFGKMIISVIDMGAGIVTMLFPKLVLEVLGGKEMPAYTIDGAEASWTGGW